MLISHACALACLGKYAIGALLRLCRAEKPTSAARVVKASFMQNGEDACHPGEGRDDNIFRDGEQILSVLQRPMHADES